jgi:two-component system cell cycle sensor histidine kinase/response regulator CckA
MNREPLRVLNLEADPEEHDRVRRHAAASGLDLVFERVADRLEFETAVRRGGIDLILADHAIPGFDGMIALESALLRLPGIPYIMVSDSIGEDRAAAALRAGARDFVHKDRLESLPAAILEAVQEPGGAGPDEAEDRFREMVETTQDVFWATDPGTGQVLYVSPAYEGIWGRPPDALFAPEGRWPEAVLAEDRPALAAAAARLRTGSPSQVEYRILRPDGAVRWILDRGFPVAGRPGAAPRVVGLAADVTERKQLETEIGQAQKTELVGKLATGIAHDFNNLLTIISGYVSMLLEKDTVSPPAAEALKRVYSASNQATGLVRQLQMFSRRRVPRPEVVDLNLEVETITVLLRRLLGESVAIEFEPAAGAPRVSVDLVMLEQVLINLAVNARDAMRGGGRLIVAVLGPADGHACIAVRDTGGGIPADILPRIFEPFFTTKAEGRGTGLGLATARDLVQRHQGRIEVETEVGVGSVFRVFLPVTAAAPAAAAAPRARSGGRQGRGTVLLVEDELNVREFAGAVLQQEGYALLQAKSAEDALEVWRWHGARIELLLTDVVLPGELSGLDLAAALQEMKPDLKVILTSGYSRESLDPQGAARAAFVLSKPYTPRALAQAVAGVLG